MNVQDLSLSQNKPWLFLTKHDFWQLVLICAVLGLPTLTAKTKKPALTIADWEITGTFGFTPD